MFFLLSSNPCQKGLPGYFSSFVLVPCFVFPHAWIHKETITIDPIVHKTFTCFSSPMAPSQGSCMLYRTMQPFQQGWKNEKVVLKGWGPLVCCSSLAKRLQLFCNDLSFKVWVHWNHKRSQGWLLTKGHWRDPQSMLWLGYPNQKKTFTFISVQISLGFGAW